MCACGPTWQIGGKKGAVYQVKKGEKLNEEALYSYFGNGPRGVSVGSLGGRFVYWHVWMPMVGTKNYGGIGVVVGVGFCGWLPRGNRGIEGGVGGGGDSWGHGGATAVFQLLFYFGVGAWWCRRGFVWVLRYR